MSAPATLRIERIAVLAPGLIGGSLARALKARGHVGEVVGWGRRESSLQRAKELGVIDRYSLDLASAVAGASIIVIATPTLIAADMLKQLAALGVHEAVITDVASVKGNLLTAAREAFGHVPANLVLGHPIAGSERSGVEAAQADLFVQHRVILTPADETSPQALEQVRALWEAVGADVVSMPVAQHDELLAATSHLPHMLAYALVDALVSSRHGEDILRFAAGGFRDFTRIASSDPQMWQEIAIANRDALLAGIDLFSAALAQLRGAIEQGDGATMLATFSRAKQARDRFVERLRKENSRE